MAKPTMKIAERFDLQPELPMSDLVAAEGAMGSFRSGRNRREGKAPQGQEIAMEEDVEEKAASGQWSSLPMELLIEVMRRVEARDRVWPRRRQLLFCAAVCRSWRAATAEVVRIVAQSGLITFPLSLKQPGPRETPVQCFIRRERATSSYFLYLGLTPALLEDNGKFLLAAHKTRRATGGTDFVISLASTDFSQASNMYVGKLRSNIMGTKFTIYDGQPILDVSVPSRSSTSRRIHPKQVSPRISARNYAVASISYEVTILKTRGPRKMLCNMQSIPVSSIQEGGMILTSTDMTSDWEGRLHAVKSPKSKVAISSFWSRSCPGPPASPPYPQFEPLVLKNKAPRWHEQLQCWCLNFRGRVTVASVKNFQLVVSVDSQDHRVSASEKERVILQFGKIGRDIFTMDYMYPLSAFQAFAICLSSFDTKHVCE